SCALSTYPRTTTRPYTTFLLQFLPPLFFSILRPPPISTLFPYTTLFRSHVLRSQVGRTEDHAAAGAEARRHVCPGRAGWGFTLRSEEHTSELQSRFDLVCRLLLEKKKKNKLTPVKGSNSTY